MSRAVKHFCANHVPTIQCMVNPSYTPELNGNAEIFIRNIMIMATCNLSYSDRRKEFIEFAVDYAEGGVVV